jgi:hypothetical protein
MPGSEGGRAEKDQPQAGTSPPGRPYIPMLPVLLERIELSGATSPSTCRTMRTWPRARHERRFGHAATENLGHTAFLERLLDVEVTATGARRQASLERFASLPSSRS